MLSIQLRSSVLIRSSIALAAFTTASAVVSHAQQAVTAPANASLFAVADTRPMDLATLAGVNYSSSSSSSSDSALPDDPSASNLTADPNGLQPPPRRRYGSPRYSDKSHNADGSNRYTFVGAVGLTLPTGNTYHYFNTNYAFQVGGGRQFNKKFAVLAQFDWDAFGLGKATLDNETALYLGSPCTPSTAPNGGCGTYIDGNNHIWSFTLDPKYHFITGEKYGAYVVGGVGFYHKVTNFTTPEAQEIETFFGPEEYTANETFDHYTSNAVGFNGGFGLTYKFSRFADEKFFVEARYVFVDNSQRQGFVYANNTNGYVGTGSNPDPNNVFPANSNRTTYVPIKVGIEF